MAAWSRSPSCATIRSCSAASSIPSSSSRPGRPHPLFRAFMAASTKGITGRHGRRRRVQQRRAERGSQPPSDPARNGRPAKSLRETAAHPPVAPSFDQMTEALSMIPTRAVLALPAAALVLSGCGAVSTLTLARPPRTSDRGHHAAFAEACGHAHIGHSRTCRRSRRDNPGSGDNEWLEIVNAAGTVVTKTLIDPTSPWLTAAGAGGAYWTQGGEEHELTRAARCGRSVPCRPMRTASSSARMARPTHTPPRISSRTARR